MKKFYQPFATVLRWSLENLRKKITKIIVRLTRGRKKGRKKELNKQTNKQTNKENFKKLGRKQLNKQTNKKIVQNLCIFSHENFNVKTKCGAKEKKSVENKWTGLFSVNGPGLNFCGIFEEKNYRSALRKIGNSQKQWKD